MEVTLVTEPTDKKVIGRLIEHDPHKNDDVGYILVNAFDFFYEVKKGKSRYSELNLKNTRAFVEKLYRSTSKERRERVADGVRSQYIKALDMLSNELRHFGFEGDIFHLAKAQVRKDACEEVLAVIKKVDDEGKNYKVRQPGEEIDF